jgi:hypothetical protein
MNWLTGGSSLAQRQKPSNTDTASVSSSSLVSSPSSSQSVVMVDGFELSVGASWLSRHKTTASMRTILEDDLLGTLPTPYNILNWMKDLRVLRVCKSDRTSLTAFGASPQSLLCYVDPWQVTIIEGYFLLIYICNFHVLSHFLLIYICKLHWNLNTIFVCQVNSL